MLTIKSVTGMSREAVKLPYWRSVSISVSLFFLVETIRFGQSKRKEEDGSHPRATEQRTVCALTFHVVRHLSLLFFFPSRGRQVQWGPKVDQALLAML